MVRFHRFHVLIIKQREGDEISSQEIKDLLMKAPFIAASSDTVKVSEYDD